MAEVISPSSKKHKKIRTLVPVPRNTFQSTNAQLIQMYDLTIGMLREGIAKGSTNTPLGIISFIAYIDLLHGGAYSVPINELPFFLQDEDKANSPYYAGNLKNTDAPQGIGGYLGSIFGGLNAGPLVQEILENANVPHVFPKLISDETYAILKCVFAWFTSTDLLKSASTGVKTLVEAASRGLEAVGTTTESIGKGISAAMPSEQQVKGLMSLLSLLEV